MRLTTKIVLGIITTIVLLTFSFIIYAAVTYEEEKPFDISKLKMTSIDIPEYKTIIIENDSPIDMTSRRIRPHGNFSIHSTESIKNYDTLPHPDFGRKDKLVLQEELKPFLRYTINNDTLSIFLTPDEGFFKSWREGNIHHNYSFIRLHVFVDSLSSIDVQSNFEGLNVSVSNMNSDRIKIKTTKGNIGVGGCKVNHLSTEVKDCNSNSLHIDHSKINELYVSNSGSDLGWVNNNSTIETGNIKGQLNREIATLNNSFKKINFIRGKRDEPIFIKVESDSVQLIFP